MIGKDMVPFPNPNINDLFHAGYSALWRIVGSRMPVGKNIFNSSWDMLIILDGCRVDLIEQISDEFDILSQIDDTLSVGSQSTEWMAKTFGIHNRNAVENTAYVTANPFTNRILRHDPAESGLSPFKPSNWRTCEPSDFHSLDEVWKYGWSSEMGTVHPRKVTDRAINIMREQSPERLIVHYMQPHYPFIPSRNEVNEMFSLDLERMSTGEGSGGGDPWQALRQGRISYETVWSAYKENLRFVLRDVELLLSNVDAKETVISSDHGNAFGEWGVYGHPIGYLHPSVKRVPWIRTTASDTGDHIPEMNSETASEADVEDRLRDLGYL